MYLGKPVNSKKRWYALYTKPRWEKKVFSLLQEKQFECYCPLNKVRKKWSDRVKLVEEPIFKSYVFVQLNEDEKTEVRFVNGVVNFVYWLGKPAIINDKDIERIKRFLSEYDNIEVLSISLKPETRVLITSGAMMDKEASVIRDRKNHVELLVESLGCKLVAVIDKKHLHIIPSLHNQRN